MARASLGAATMDVGLAFDRGTLRLAAPAIPPLPHVRWDPRTSCPRAPARAYAQIREAAASAGIALADEVAPRLATELTFEEPSLRSYQRDARDAWLAAGRRGVVAIPTGSGKTRVAIACMARARAPTLVLCPTRALLEQWQRELSRFYRGTIGVVGDGAFNVADVTVMTFESAYRRLDVLGDRFALLVADEVHHFATGRQEALDMAVAPMRLGLSATPPSELDPQFKTLEELVGPIVFEMRLDELVGKHLADLEIVRLRVSLDESEREAYERAYRPFVQLRATLGRGLSWQDFTREASRTEAGRRALAGYRQAFEIVALPKAKRRLVTELLARHERDRVLVFTAFARDAYVVSRENLVPVITSDITRRERSEILERFCAGTYRAIVSARVLNEGLDVPDARVAIVAGAALGDREHVQRAGRVLRPAPGKRARLYELVTQFSLEERRADTRRRSLAL